MASNVDLWIKNIAPSNSLHRWFNYDPNKWEEFREEYYKELDSKGQEVIADMLKKDKRKEICDISLRRKR